MHTETADCIVIGAGIIGLAIAARLAQNSRDVLVLEQEKTFGTGISARSSEVIHAGIYYPAGSLKARLCVQGKKMLYEYAAQHGIPHKNCGKLIVATSKEQEEALEQISQKAQKNDVHDLQALTASQAKALEPALNCTAALLSPSTGIIDTHALMLTLLGDLEHNGGLCAFNTSVTNIDLEKETINLTATCDGLTIKLTAKTVINACGLGAIPLTRSMKGFPANLIPQNYYAKGNYFCLQGRAPFTRLIYPVPEKAGLGIHLTLDMGGKARFGPDVEWIDTPDYKVNPARAEKFYPAIRSYWPELPDHALAPDYAGIRPKIQGPDDPTKDFLILGPQDHGHPGLVQLFGIESPGITASLALAQRVADTL